MNGCCVHGTYMLVIYVAAQMGQPKYQLIIFSPSFIIIAAVVAAAVVVVVVVVDVVVVDVVVVVVVVVVDVFVFI